MHWLRSAIATGALAAGLLVSPGPAAALTVTTSATDCLGSVEATFAIGSADPTGTAVLMVDGAVVAVRPAVPSQRIGFPRLTLKPGRHKISALLRSSAGASSAAPAFVKVWSRPTAASLASPAGGYASRYVTGVVKTGLWTTSVHVYVNGVLVRSVAVAENALQNIGTLEMKAGVNTIRIVSGNPVATTVARYNVTRLDFPWATCIVVDKSDFKLYWVRNGLLVKAYPIAHGRVNARTPSATWRIDAKYNTDPASVYGPRKMRMFRQSGSSFVFTAYAIHGTNQPWVIGTQASAGCIRMYNSDVLELFPQVPLGTMVQTRE